MPDLNQSVKSKKFSFFVGLLLSLVGGFLVLISNIVSDYYPWMTSLVSSFMVAAIIYYGYSRRNQIVISYYVVGVLSLPILGLLGFGACWLLMASLVPSGGF